MGVSALTFGDESGMVEPVRMLVVYGSARGGTAGLAHMVADALSRHQIRTDVRRASDVRSIEEYDAIVVGGALYNNRWHPDAVVFVGRRRAALRELPVWFFSSGPLDDSARSGALAPVPQVTTLAREIDIRGHMTFGGVLTNRPTGLLGRFAWGPEGDFRDRHQVAEWAERIAAELLHEPTVRVIESTRSEAPAAAPEPVLDVPPPRDVDAAEPEDVVLDLDQSVPHEARLKPGRLSRIRNYLDLDVDEEESEDEGLDLLLDLADS